MLNTPLRFPCGLTVPNRIAKASMTERMASAQGEPTPRLQHLFSCFAQGGVGMLLTGNVAVNGIHLEAYGNAVLEDERHLESFRRWAVAGQSRGGAMVMQINHPGRQAMRGVTQYPVAPSAVGLPSEKFFARPRALSEAGIAQIIAQFIRSAQLAQIAGFSGVQVHAAHGYLLSQFLSPNVNQRTDQWGGSLANRARLLLRIVEGIRKTVPENFAVGVKLNAGDFVKGGMPPEDAVQVIGLLDPLGLDFIEISGGTFERPASFGYGLSQSTLEREGYFLDLARQAREHTSLPLMVTGGLRSAQAMENALAEGACDLVGLARPLAVEPALPARLLIDPQARAAEVCISLPKGPIASLAELSWYRDQLERTARGEPVKMNASPRWAVARMLLRDKWLAWQRQRYMRSNEDRPQTPTEAEA